VNTEFGMWPGTVSCNMQLIYFKFIWFLKFESYFDGNPEMIRYSLFLCKMEKKIFIIQKDSIFPFPLEKIEVFFSLMIQKV
jgi:hypothetical protein